MLRLFRELIVQIILAILLAYFITPYLAPYTVQCLYTVSTIIKDLLMCVLPIIIFSYIFSSMLRFARSAPLLIILILITITLGNIFYISLSYYSTLYFIPKMVTPSSIGIHNVEELSSLYSIPIPSKWSPGSGMLAGFVIGIIMSFRTSNTISDIAHKLRDYSTRILQKLFIPIVPLFILGFIAKMRFEGTINMLIQHYGIVVAYSFVFVVLYLVLFMIIAHGFNLRSAFQQFRQSIGSMITAFTTMSSLAALPLNLEIVKKQTGDEDFTNFVLPLTANIHMIGDGIIFGTTIAALTYMYQLPVPSHEQFAIFLGYYALSKFSVAGVPAASTIITMPLIEKYLGMPQEIVAIFFTICVLKDCIITLGNATGNAIYAVFFHRLFGKFFNR